MQSLYFIKSDIDRRIHQMKLSMLLHSLPTISLSSHFSSLFVKIMTLSSSSFMIFLALNFNSFSFGSLNSPSKTEFWIQHKYFLHNFSIFPTLFSPKSYTRITYIYYHHILKGLYSSIPSRCLLNL
jgi:hypothetical protein